MRILSLFVNEDQLFGMFFFETIRKHMSWNGIKSAYLRKTSDDL
jgi:hypothetical protein